MKSINPELIGDFKSIEYPARRQFPSDEIVERWKNVGHLYVNYTGLIFVKSIVEFLNGRMRL